MDATTWLQHDHLAMLKPLEIAGPVSLESDAQSGLNNKSGQREHGPDEQLNERRGRSKDRMGSERKA